MVVIGSANGETIRHTAMIAGPIGAVTLWLSTNSIPGTIKDADGKIEANLEFFGWDSPPDFLATTAADNIGATVGIVLMLISIIFLCVWLWGRFMAKGREKNTNEAGIEGNTFEDNGIAVLTNERDNRSIKDNIFRRNGIGIQLNKGDPDK